VDVFFRTRQLQKVCSNERLMQRELGKKMATKLGGRLMELKAADVLADISHLPPSRLHELTNRGGVFSVDLEYPNRLLMIVADNPVPTKGDGGIDLANVRSVEIIAIEDTHDPKNQRK
jgi:hypothetical protein